MMRSEEGTLAGPASPCGSALVVFTDDGPGDGPGLWWLRWLRPGFRHVLVVLRHRGGLGAAHWVLINPLAHHTQVAVLADRPPAVLAAWLRTQGYVVVHTTVRIPPHHGTPLAPLTCVEVVKRLLGLRARWVLTPWALFRHLTEGRDFLLDGARRDRH